MNFNEVLKDYRKKNKLTQAELAKKIGVTTRALQNWETQTSFPTITKTIKSIVDVLGMSFSEIFSEEDQFMMNVRENSGARAQREAKMLISRAGALFAGGELTDEDQQEVLKAIMDAYVEAKKENQKYIPKSRRKTADN